MGYTTEFEGQFAVTPVLRPEHVEYLKAFAGTRRMRRDPRVTAQLTDTRREAAGLPVGPEGAYYVGSVDDGNFGQGDWRTDKGHPLGVIEYNSPQRDQPGLWCQWVPTENGQYIEWNGAEKFRSYVEWLKYLVAHFLGPWGYRIDGRVKWQGESSEDIGLIIAEGNVVSTLNGRVVFGQ